MANTVSNEVAISNGAPTRRITVNGKYLTGSLNGVHRVAGILSRFLLTQATNQLPAGAHPRVLAPPAAAKTSAFSEFNAEAVQGLSGSGQYWENVTLPRHSWNDLLVNFCNLAPILHPNSVVMIHDAQTFLRPKDYSTTQSRAYRLMLPLIGKRARMALTVSEFSKRSLVDFGITTADKIRVVHNGGDHILWTPADESVLEEHSLVPGSYHFTIGSTKAYKNTARLFDLFRQPAFSDRTLVLAGAPTEDDFQALEMSPPPNTIFVGPVTDAQLRALYENAATFLFPSQTEGFGLPPLEAMFCGCPVVCANAGAMPEVCGAAATLVDPDETDKWAEAVLALDDADARAALVARGYERSQTLTWDNAGRQLTEALSDLV